MPRANAKASKKSASAEEQELLRLRKELMEKQAKLKRVLAQEKRQGSGVLQAVRGPPSCAFARRTRSRRAFGMSWFLTPALTRPANPPTRSPRTQAPSARDDPQARNQGYVAHRAPRFARWNRSRPARRAVRRRAETKNPYAASRFVREDVRKMDRLRHPSSAPRRRRTPFRFTHLRVLLRFKSRSPRVPHATHERHARSADGASEPST
jgi:hypothetical protein